MSEVLTDAPQRSKRDPAELHARLGHRLAGEDGARHAATLVSIFCIPPTFDPTVDAAGDLPGPGAALLYGDAQLQ